MMVLLYYRIIALFAGEKIFKIGMHLGKVEAKWLIASHAIFSGWCIWALGMKVSTHGDKAVSDVQTRA